MNVEQFDTSSLNAALACEDLQRKLSPLDTLKQHRSRLAQQLADQDAAIEALEANPEILRVLSLLAKAGHAIR